MGEGNQETYTVAASTTIYAGDIVALNSSGQLVQALALPGSNNSVTASGGTVVTLGVALQSITTNASGIDTTGPFNISTIPVAIWDANTQYLFRTYDATAANTTLANLKQGKQYQFGRYRGASATSWWYVMILTQTNGEFFYVEPFGNSEAVPGANDQLTTDQYAAVWTQATAAYRAVN